MAKTIKFNLRLDGTSVRGLDDLREHFNLDDLLTALRNGALGRWLLVRDLAPEAEEIGKLAASGQDDLETARGLCRVFRKDLSPGEIEAAVWPFTFREENEEKLRALKALDKEHKAVIAAYHEGYRNCLERITGGRDDYPFLKALMEDIIKEYQGLFKIDVRAFYERFIDEAPLTLLTALSASEPREILAEAVPLKKIFHDLTIETERKDVDLRDERVCGNEQELSVLKKAEKNIWIVEYPSDPQFNNRVIETSLLPPDAWPFRYVFLKDPVRLKELVKRGCLKTFAGETDGYWKDVEPRDKKILVIKMEPGNMIRNAEKRGEELKAEDVNGAFPILDGLDYKSNSAADCLVYMEV